MEITFNLALVPLALALVQIIKQVPYFAADWVKSLLALLIGIGLVYLDAAPPVREMIMQGLVVGVSSMGLYTGAVKPMIAAFKSQ